MTDYTFASALLNTKSASLLSKPQFRELKTADDEGYILKLQSFGYGLDDKSKAVDAIIAGEVLKLKEELIEIMPYDNLPSFFFTKYDLTNIRSLYKKKFFQAETGPFEIAGFLSEKELSQAIIKDDYYGLIEPYKQLITKVDEQFLQDSFELVTFIQKTFQKLLHEQILKRKDSSLEKYFAISTDINNLLSLLRGRKMKLEARMIEENLLELGSIEISEIKDLLYVSDHEIVTRFSTLYMARFCEPLERFFESGDFATLEHSLLTILLDELSSDAIDIKSSAAIIMYIIRKQIEIIDIRRLYLNRDAKLMVEAT